MRIVSDRHITLQDGRRLAFAEFGDPSGTPLFFFHGAGSTRLTRHPDDSIIEELQVRLITVNRPGIGLSDARPGRRLLDWPSDVSQLADALGIDRFPVLGWSAGGPFALACAYRIPRRVTSVGVMSGLAPLHWPGMGTVLSGLRSRAIRLLQQSQEERGALALPRVDTVRYPATPENVAGRPEEVRAMNRQRFPDLVRSRDWERIRELAMLARPWGFHLEEVDAVVHLWHGSRDRTIPLYMAEHVVRVLPRAVLTVFPDEGHHAGFTHWREVLQALLASHHGEHVSQHRGNADAWASP